MRWSPRLYGRLVCMLAFGGPVLFAQGTQTATINGTVVTAKGDPIADAYIKLTSPALQGERQLRSDAAGHFRAPLLPPGEYKILITKDGLDSVTLNQRVGLEQTFSPRVILKATSGSTVEVVGNAITADKAEFKQAVNYTKDTIDNLPIQRSNLLDIAYLAPGVVENVMSARGGVQIRGSMGAGNLFLVDGQNVMDNLYSGQRIPIIFDTVDETQVLTGALPAEYGDVEGGVVNSVTKSGGDDFTASLRFDFNNPGQNAVKSHADRSDIAHNWNMERSLQIGGPIIKSKLWFHIGYFSANPTPSMVGGAGGAAAGVPGNGNGFGYIREDRDYRREFKLTWAINEDNTLSASYHANQNDRRNADYGAGDISDLTYLITKGDFWNLQWRSLLTTNATLSVKFGQKHQSFPNPGGGVDPNIWTLYNFDDGYGYRNQWFDPRDPIPDQRDNQTANIKFTYFLNAVGFHQIDVGMDYYSGSTKASGAATPNYFTIGGVTYNNYGVNVWGLDFTNGRVAGGGASVDSIDGLQFFKDKATVVTQGYYLNDKWQLNNHWNFQLGLRVDHYDASSEAGGHTSSAWSFAPRLGAKWDLFGDSKWAAGLSYAKYNGRVLESTLQNVTYVNNAPYKEWMWAPGGYANQYDSTPVSFAAMQNLANYYTLGYVGHNDAHLNMRIDPNLKPQQVDEWQLSLAHNFESRLGSGYIKFNWVDKKWSHLIDYTQGNNGGALDPGLIDPNLPEDQTRNSRAFIRVYQNSTVPIRRYKSAELEGSLTKGPWTLSGNVVYASLEGNFVGEGAASPGRGQGLEYYTIQNGVYMYERNITNPVGKLPGDKPLRWRVMGGYAMENFLGKLNLGLLYRYDTGDVFNRTRSIRRSSLNPDLDPQFGSRATQYLGNTRGNEHYPSYRYFDLSIQQDFKLLKLASGRALNFFAKVDITNVFNHQQRTGYDVTYDSLPGGDPITNPFVPGSNFGASDGPGYWGEARALRFSVGLKF